MADAIVGRDAELAAVHRFIERVRTGPRALVFAGAAGMGKTTLWRAGVRAARAGSLRVLEARPAESERGLAFAGVADLLGPELDEALATLSGPQRRALRVALLLDEPEDPPPDRRAVASAFLGALRALAARGPVLVAVDDVQWLDASSVGVVGFAARRLRTEPAAILLAERVADRVFDPLGLRRAFDDELEEVEVGPLSLGALHTMLHQRLGEVFPRPTLRRLHEVAGGNPFFALELARAVLRRGGRLDPGQPLPVPERMHELVQDRLAVLPAETRMALAAAAALSQPTVELVGGPDVLAPAVEAEIAAVEDGRVQFTHPLLASGAYAALPVGRRAELHARLAAAVGDLEERARHLALAARGPDEKVAATLEEAAKRAAARGAPDAAAELLEQAADLTPTVGAAARKRRLEAAVHHLESGDLGRARVLLEGLLEGLPAGSERAGVLVRLARVRSYDDDIRAAAELFERAVVEAGGDLALEAEAREGLAANLFRLRERLPEAVDHGRRAAELALESGDRTLGAEALGSQALAEAALGRPEARATIELALRLQPESEHLRILRQPKFAAAVCWSWWGELGRAREAYEELLARARTIGDDSSPPYLLVLLGQIECYLGEIELAARRADEGLALAEQAGQRTLAAYLLALRAFIGAQVAGDSVGPDAERALDLARRTAGVPAEYLAGWALGLHALSLGDAERAASVLAPLAERAHANGFVEPGATRFVTDAVEALAEVDCIEEAEEILVRYERSALELGRGSVLLPCARVRSVLDARRGAVESALGGLELAVSEHELETLPLERARSLLVLGALRRRARQKRSAREALEAALEAFEALGANGWIGRARAELARIGGRARGAAGLTPSEERVAALVASGLSNKEVAARLFVSVKTVEGHVSHIYAKLGIRSRAALAGRLASRS